jgi:hypothetical protein
MIGGVVEEKKEAKVPTLRVQTHPTNLMPLKNGDIPCVWFSGTQEGMGDFSVCLSRLKTGASRGTGRAIALGSARP